MTEVVAEGLLNFWFGKLDANGVAAEAKQKQWFAKDDAFDKSIKSQYGSLMELAPMGAYDRWSLTPEGRTALIVLLDQFPRNLFRGQARSFYTDEKAQFQTRKAVEAGEHLSLPISYAYFTLMPLMHAEHIEAQEELIKHFTLLHDREMGKGKSLMENALKYAVMHRDIIAQFGRFPHRNHQMQRESTKAELDFLANGGPTF
ncbi:MAG: DUF924 domain-containing protein [Proteobacteria bacterium]|nr:MAG: DUF924 domain-containing protein [Pseudomonadota bacterium]